MILAAFLSIRASSGLFFGWVGAESSLAGTNVLVGALLLKRGRHVRQGCRASRPERAGL